MNGECLWCGEGFTLEEIADLRSIGIPSKAHIECYAALLSFRLQGPVIQNLREYSARGYFKRGCGCAKVAAKCNCGPEQQARIASELLKLMAQGRGSK